MIVRDYRESDAEATLAVFRQAIRQTASADYSPEQIAAWASEDIDLAAWAAKRQAAGTIVAVVDDRVVGFTDLRGDGYIDMMFVDPDVGRRGVASVLLDWVIEAARERGVVELDTHASITAKPFFERHGFEVVVERHPVLRGVEMTNFLMRRRSD